MEVPPIKIRYPGIGQSSAVSPNLQICRLKGSPNEVGRQYGKLFSEDLLKFQKLFRDSLTKAAGKFLSKIVYYVALPFYAALQWARIPSSIRQEIKGMAEGSSLSLFQMIRLSSLYDFMVNIALAGANCSSFAKMGKDGNLLIGRNFDINYDPSQVLTRSPLILYEIDGQKPFISIGPVFFNAAPVTAILKGESGNPLFFAIHNVIGPRKWFGKPTITLLRELLNKSTFGEAAKFLKASDETCSKIIIFADSQNAAVAEIAGGKTTVIREMKEGFIAATNNYVTPRTKKYINDKELTHGLAFNPRVRLFSLTNFWKGREPSLEATIAALSSQHDHTRNKIHPWGDIVSPSFNNDERKPRVPNINRTYYSVVLEYGRGMLWVGAGEYAPNGDFFGFKLSDLFSGGEETQAEIFPQTANLENLNRGRRLTEELRKGKDVYEEGSFRAALYHLKSVYDIDPEHIEAHILEAAILLEFKNYKRAAEILKKVVFIEDSNKVLPQFRRGSAFAYLLLGIITDMSGKRDQAKRDQAKDYYKKVLSLERDNEFGAEAAVWANMYLNYPCLEIPSHRELATLLL